MLRFVCVVSLQRMCQPRRLTTVTPTIKGLLGANVSSASTAPELLTTPSKCVHNSPLRYSSGVVETDPAKLGKVDVKMRLVFTCKKCDTRNDKIMSKHAYTKGIVIVRCDGCEKLHLIADNLDWFKNPTGRNVEEFLAAKGEKVIRGGEDVLEVLGHTGNVPKNKSDVYEIDSSQALKEKVEN